MGRQGTCNVVLECGCTIPLVATPRAGSRFSCFSGLRHGSGLVWVKSAEPNGFTRYNPKGPEAELAGDRNPEELRSLYQERAQERDRLYSLRDAPEEEPPGTRIPQQRKPGGVQLLLSCGCTKTAKTEPLPNEHFACPKRLHGVSVRWKHAEIGERLMVNTGPGY